MKYFKFKLLTIFLAISAISLTMCSPKYPEKATGSTLHEVEISLCGPVQLYEIYEPGNKIRLPDYKIICSSNRIIHIIKLNAYVYTGAVQK